VIILDTNIISELWKISPNANVLIWVDAQAIETLYVTAITVAELRFGIASMPKGKRRNLYQERFERQVLPAFNTRVLPFDVDASGAYADLMAKSKLAGKTIAQADGYIASIARVRHFAVATRDLAPFQAAQVDVINPWIENSPRLLK
jgi:toxin FitB